MENRNKYKITIFLCYLSYITQAIVVNFTPVLFVTFQNIYKITFEEIGRLVLINFLVQISVDYLSIKIIDRIGYRRTAIFAHLCSALGLILLCVLPQIVPNPYLGIVGSTVVFAMGGGIIEVVISPLVDAIPSNEKSSAMSLLHSFYCWGQLLVVLFTTLALNFIGTLHWGYISCFWAIIPIICLIGFTKTPIAPMVTKDERLETKHLFSSKFFVAALIMMLCTGSAEMTLSQWASLFAEKGLGIPKMLGDIFGPCLFAVFMGSGRVAYGIWGKKINLRKTLMVCSSGCICTYLLTSLSHNAVISLFSCALTGLFVSLMWPGVISLSSARFPKGGALMFGFLALFGDLGCSLGPWISGLVSDAVSSSGELMKEQFGLKMGILSTTIFPVILLIILSLMKEQKNLSKRT